MSSTECLYNSLKNNNSSSTELILNKNQVDDEQNIKNLGKDLESNRVIQKIILTSCELYDNDIKIFFNQLISNNTITEIDLSDNYIGEKGVKAIVNFFPKTKIFNKLNLSDNEIGNTGAKYLSDANFGSLRSINLSKNEIGDIGTKYIALSLKNTKLSELDLSNNDISDKGAKYLSDVNFGSLKTINLNNNSIGNNGAKQIGLSLKNSNLSKLDLSNNDITNSGAKTLINQIKSINRTIMFTLQNSEIENETCSTIDLSQPPTLSPISYDNGKEEIDSDNENKKISQNFQNINEKKDSLIKEIETKISDEISKINKIQKSTNSFDEIVKNELNNFETISTEFFEKKLKMLKENYESKLNSIEKKIKEFENKNDLLSKEANIKHTILTEQKKIYFNPSVRTFYFTIRSLLESKLISMLLLLGNILKREDTKAEKRIVETTEVLTGALDAIPAGGIIGNAIALFISEAMGKKIDKNKLKKAKKIQNLCNLNGASKYAELIARRIAQNYKKIISEKRISIKQAQDTGNLAANLIFEAINDEKNILDFNENDIQTFTIKIENSLFQDDKTKSHCRCVLI